MIDLKEKRIEKGYSQQQLADTIFCVRQTISEIESGRNMPSIETAKQLAKVLGFNWYEIFE